MAPTAAAQLTGWAYCVRPQTRRCSSKWRAIAGETATAESGVFGDGFRPGGNGDRPFVRFGDRVWTHAEFLAESARWANLFLDRLARVHLAIFGMAVAQVVAHLLGQQVAERTACHDLVPHTNGS